MFSYSRSISSSIFHSALLLIFAAAATAGAQSSSSSQPDAPAAQTPAAQQPSNSHMTVQERIKARREQRRQAAIHDVYSHLYEVYVGAGYLRFTPGDALQRVNEYAWNLGVTRYYNEKLGVTVDGRGLYGSAYIGPNAASNSAVTKPAVRQYTAMIGPTYRFVLHPRFSVSGRIMAGGSFANFSSDLGTFTTKELGLYQDGASLAFSASVPVEYNLSPEIGLRLAPEYMMTNFGSSIQNNLGYTGGIVVRWGKQ